MKGQDKKIVVLAIAVLVLSAGALAVSYADDYQNVSAAPEVNSPGDWIKEEQIEVYPNQVILNLQNAHWLKFTDTNSMDPLFDAEANVLEMPISQPEEIHEGDIVAYKAPEGLIVHRVVKISSDEKGPYYLVKGDNNPLADPYKIRFENIRGVIVGIIY